MDWDSLNISWKHHGSAVHISWQFRTVSRPARLDRRQGNEPRRPFLNVEEYSRDSALVLVKEFFKEWLMNHRSTVY